MSEQEQTLRKSYDALKKQGVRDLKFAFAPLAERTKDQVFASVNTVLDAISTGKSEEFTGIGDSRGRRKRA